MNGQYSISYFFILLFKTQFIASKLQLYIPESITLLDCLYNVLWSCGAVMVAAAIKKDCSYRNNCGIRLQDGDLEHSLMKEKNLHMFFFPYLCFAIQDLGLGILKMSIMDKSVFISWWFSFDLWFDFRRHK